MRLTEKRQKVMVGVCRWKACGVLDGLCVIRYKETSGEGILVKKGTLYGV